MAESRNTSVLLVDDDPDGLQGYKRTLRKYSDVTTAENGSGGLEAIDQHGEFAGGISDMRMPEMDGVEFLR
ncbi:MAG: response regulator [Rhodospirillales bacterium]